MATIRNASPLSYPTFPEHAPSPHAPSRKTRAYRGSFASTRTYRTPISRARRPRNEAIRFNVRARFPTSHTRLIHMHTHLRARLRKTRARANVPPMYGLCAPPLPPSPQRQRPKPEDGEEPPARPVHRQVPSPRPTPAASLQLLPTWVGQRSGSRSSTASARDRFCALKARR